MKGSKSISILGFRVPTICGRKNFDDHIKCLCVPTTWKYSAHPIFIHIGAKGLCRPHHGPKILVKGSKGGPIGGISILGCMVPTTCGAGSGKDQGS